MKEFLINYSVLFFIALTLLISSFLKALVKWRSFNNATLIVLNKQWVPAIEEFATLFLLVGIFLNFVFAFLGVMELGVGALIGVVGSFLMGLVYYFCFYLLIKCPECGHVLTKYKNGKNMPMKNAYIALTNCSPCRKCGWAANVA